MSEEPPVASILLVDDNVQNLVVLGAALEPLGQRLVKATSGREALRRLEEEDFAVILLDVRMPDMDGYQTAHLIKAQERTRHIPLLFLTALQREDRHLLRGYAQGAVDYLLKPFEAEVLRAKVGVFVELYRRGEALKLREAKLREQEREALLRQGEAHSRALLNAMPQAVWAARPDGTQAWCNAAWTALLGSPGAELEPRSLVDSVHPSERETVLAGIREALRSGRPWDGQHRLGRPESYRWHHLKVTPLPASGQAWSGFLCTATDIDDERRTQQISQLLSHASVMLSSSLDYHATLARLAQLVVPRFADWCTVDVLDRGASLAGLTRVAVAHAEQGKAERVLELHQRYPPREDDVAGVARVLLSGQPELLSEVPEPVLRRMASDEAHLALLREVGLQSRICVPIRARERNFGALTFGISGGRQRYDRRDVALAEELGRRAAVAMDNALLYRDTQRAQQEAQEANRLKDEFLATLSHELRTPLTSILGWTQMLLRRDDLDEAGRRRGLETIERNARVQRQLVEDLLDVSRITAGKLTLELREVPLREVVESALESVRPTAEARGVQLQTDLDGVSESVLADPTRLQQVLWNLLTNALKFTERGGRVRLLARRDGPSVALTVSDTGKGIEPGFLPHVFERFRQGNTGRGHGGLGLGLAIVRTMVELHGGTVDVHSDGPGTGATFTVRLPLREGPEAQQTSGQPAGASPLAGVKVLFLGNPVDARESVEGFLRSAGAEVRVVGSLAEALAALAQLRPDVLVSDILLPGEDGFALMRNQEVRGRIPALALCGHAHAEDPRRVLDEGFQMHLCKPVASEELTAAVTALLGRARAEARADAQPV
ncbi:response regulator [Stigmatella erecta]|uniref:histidine kinase n=1 Tax=Stigmatella erecta TaxID=83460 RepID=A0A1I0L452_9BACT|nr:response regulator [Stigmatella erecta]SEU34089.1 PAS domain S-box-containing protein [Stigmatella erecta]